MESLPWLQASSDWPLWIKTLEAYCTMDQQWDQIDPTGTSPVVSEKMPELPKTREPADLAQFEMEFKHFKYCREKRMNLFKAIRESLNFPNAQNVVCDDRWREEGLRGLVKAIKAAIAPDDAAMAQMLQDRWNGHLKATVDSYKVNDYMTTAVDLFQKCASYRVFEGYDVLAVKNLLSGTRHLDQEAFEDAMYKIDNCPQTTGDLLDILNEHKLRLWAFGICGSRRNHLTRRQ